MSPKAIGIVLLAMSGSFVTILAVLGYAVAGDSAPRNRSRYRQADVVSVTPPAPAPRELPSSQSRSPRTRAQPDPVLDVPDQAQPLSDSAVDLPPPPGPAPELAQLARTTQRRLQGVEDALASQVAALKKSRDAMLDELAGQLATNSVDEAVISLKPLDDETAALTLTRLGTARRQAILRNMPEKRRKALESHLRRLQK